MATSMFKPIQTKKWLCVAAQRGAGGTDSVVPDNTPVIPSITM